jgi:hypothetical protein
MTTSVLPPTSSAQATEEHLRQLRNLLATNRRRWKFLIALEGLALALSVPLACFWVVVLLDQRFHLPLVGRLLGANLFVAGIGWGVWHLLRRRRQMHLSEDQVALAIERRTPGGLQNRLINALQIARQQHHLSEAVVDENVQTLRHLQLEQAAQMRPALMRSAVASVLIMVGVVLWLWRPLAFSNAAARILMPLAHIDPLYRTRLAVEPGDVEASGNVPIRIRVEGERPASLVIHRVSNGKRHSEVIPVTDAGAIEYTLREVLRDTEYAVRGGDFATPTYRITVPRRATFTRLKATYIYPEYTGLASRHVETTAGDLDALEGTRAELTYTFDQPIDAVTLEPDRSTTSRDRAPLPLVKSGEREFSGTVAMQDLLGYHLAVTPAGRTPQRLGPYAVRLGRDQEPKLEMNGVERRAEAAVDAVLSLKIQASDDFGLREVGLFYRKAEKSGAKSDDTAWQPIEVWRAGKQNTFRTAFDLPAARLALIEGDKIELALRGKDYCPFRSDWTLGPLSEIFVGGDGVALQTQYEQILRSDKEMKQLVAAQEALLAKTVTWLRKLDGDSDLRWDDPKNVDTLHAAAKTLKIEQDRLREQTAETARNLLVATGNLRLGLGLLADTEMDRIGRIFDAVVSREMIPAKQKALADARATQERIAKSLEDMTEQHARFRSDWELGNMIPFVKMLSERQTKLRDHAKVQLKQVGTEAEKYQRVSVGRRQGKVLDLCKLIQPAFDSLSERLREQEVGLSAAFARGSATLGDAKLHEPMTKANEAALAGKWSEALPLQTSAAEQLAALHADLRKAQVEAAQKALDSLKEKAKTDLESQKELEKLQEGSGDSYVKDFPENMKLEDTMRLREVVAGKKKTAEDLAKEFEEKGVVALENKRITLEKDSGVRQDTDTLKLGKTSEATKELKLYKGDMNAVKPFIQEKFDDLVGKLLDEADELTKNYQTINKSTNQNNNDPGEISKLAGAINSTGAVAATGNKKPPATNTGGVSRTGRQGARAYGKVADDAGLNLRGRDKALEGMEKIADQAGKHKLNKSDDMQQDTSTGIGGKKIDSDDNHFSLKDAGKWRDEILKKLDKPQAKHYQVERQGDKIDHKIVAQMFDLESKQEQVIERLKAIKKELRNLYLPTDHLDELMRDLTDNLDSLKERPDDDLFRLQMQTLDRLRGTVSVFRGAGSNFQPSLPRERVLRGRVLDEPESAPLPGYEDAVKQYYLRLAEQ